MTQVKIRVAVAILMICCLCLSGACASDIAHWQTNGHIYRLAALPLATGGISIVDTQISTATTRDGVTVTLGYQISSESDAVLSLGAALTGPNGEQVTSTEPDPVVSVAAGTHWFYRSFLVNLPPLAPSGDYDVEWSVYGDVGTDCVVREDFLAILPPVPVRVPIIYYHKIAPEAPSQYYVLTEDFRSQMEALKVYGYTAVTLQEIMDCRAGLATLPAKPILITFDDGYENWYTDAFPVLSDPAINFKAAFFIATSRMGGTNAWDKDNNPIINMLTWEEIQTLNSSGLIDFESHSATHQNLKFLAMYKPWMLPPELVDSKNELNTRLNQNTKYICYPYGLNNLDVQIESRKAGYFAGLGTVAQIETTCADKWALKRMCMGRETNLNYMSGCSPSYLFGPGLLNDPDVPRPNIALNSVQYLDAATSLPLVGGSVTRGQLVKVRVSATNTGPVADVRVRLKIDSDSDTSNGLMYDSHLTDPVEDVPVVFTPGTRLFEWVWQVPADAPSGRYYTYVKISDQYCLVGYRSSGWQPAFMLWPTTGSPGGLKSNPDGTWCDLEDMIVSAVFDDCFYVQARDRSSGIRVELENYDFDVDMLVDVAGWMLTKDNGERYIAAETVDHVGYDSARPLGIVNACVAGGDLGRQEGVWVYRPMEGTPDFQLVRSPHVSNIGLLIRAWGHVVEISTPDHSMTIDDGSGTHVKCLLPDGVTPDPDWGYVIVTGIATSERIDGLPSPVIRVRGLTDIIHHDNL